MPIVTKLSAQKRAGYYNIFVDDEFWCGLTDLQVVTLGLHKGTEISEGEADKLKELSSSTKTYHAAIRFLSYRMRSQQEIEKYLKKKNHEEHIEEVVARLQAEKYLDDEDFARRWVAMRQLEGKSPRVIGIELAQKGIDRDFVSLALEEYEEEDRLESLRHALKKLRAAGKPLEKVIQSLQRKGWSYGQIKTILEEEA